MEPSNGSVEVINWQQFEADCHSLFSSLLDQLNTSVLKLFGIPSGGSNVALTLKAIADQSQLFLAVQMVDEPDSETIIVDDIVDSGETAKRYESIAPVYAVYHNTTNAPADLRRHSLPKQTWLKFPWEAEHGPESNVVRLLQHIGENPSREGLRDTPKRVIKALKEMTVGYSQDPAQILSTVFKEQCDEIVLLKDIPFHSLCEHHMLPFSGVAHVAYIPRGSVVGLSKLARLTHCFANRLQVQERLTNQIADAISQHLSPVGVAVIVEATHQCMTCRGIKVHGSTMVTSSMRGAFRDHPSARAELLALLKP